MLTLGSGAGVCQRVTSEVVVAGCHRPGGRRGVRDDAQRAVLSLGRSTEFLRGSRDIRSTLLPVADTVGLRGRVERVELRAGWRVHAALAGVRIRRVGYVPLTRHTVAELRVTRLVAAD